VILDPKVAKFKRSRSSSPRLSSDALLSGQATNAWAMGTSVDDVSTLSSLGGVVRSMGATTNALPPRMVRTCSGFWPWRLLHRRWPLRTWDTSVINRAEELRGRKIKQSGMPNRTIRFPRGQQQHLVTSRSRGHLMNLLLISWEAVKRT
jgi:hypothetical protein